jgi:hypothetical protein
VTDVNDCPPSLSGSTRVRVASVDGASVSVNFTVNDADDWTRGNGPPFQAYVDPKAEVEVQKRVALTLLSGA